MVVSIIEYLVGIPTKGIPTRYSYLVGIGYTSQKLETLGFLRLLFLFGQIQKKISLRLQKTLKSSACSL